MSEVIVKRYEFFTLQRDDTSVTLQFAGRPLLKLALHSGKCSYAFEPETALNMVRIVSSHLCADPEIVVLHGLLGLPSSQADIETDRYLRHLLQCSLEYSLPDAPPLFSVPELCQLRLMYRGCSSSVPDAVRLEFCYWLFWLKWRFGRALPPDLLARAAALLPIFTVDAYWYFRELATIATALFQQEACDALCQLVSEFAALSERVPAAERDRLLQESFLTRVWPAELAEFAFLAELVEQMRQRSWGGYALSEADAHGRKQRVSSVAVILSQCMLGLGDMALFVSLVRSIKTRYPSVEVSAYLFNRCDEEKLRLLMPVSCPWGGEVFIGFDSLTAARISKADLAIYVTAPWSYNYGRNPILEGPRAAATIYLSGLDWNRSQRYVRRYPDGRIEALLPVGFSPHLQANPLDLTTPWMSDARSAFSPLPERARDCPLGLIYAGGDPRAWAGALRFLKDLREQHARFVYCTFINEQEFENDAREALLAGCREAGIVFVEPDDLRLEVPDCCLLLNLGIVSQATFIALVQQAELPSVITGTMTVLFFLLLGKPFIHLGNHPNARTLKRAAEDSLLVAYRTGHLTRQEYGHLIKYMNLLVYSFTGPKSHWVRRDFGSIPLLDSELEKILGKWRSFLLQRRFSLFSQLEEMVEFQAGSGEKTQPRPELENSLQGAATPTFETVYDDTATRIWNEFRYGLCYLKLGTNDAFYRLLKRYPLRTVKLAYQELAGNPYRTEINKLLQAAIAGDAQEEQRMAKSGECSPDHP